MGSVTFEEFELQNDSKYKMYLASIDKALKSFEYTSEWADLISALGKLNKILIHHQKYPVIPRRMKISKRLAQCLHPALPSGVHLKALETYDIMFRTMGTNRLSQELFIYSSGLFPVLSHAATNVKPSLLTIYENHFVPLGEKLIPGLSGFLSGVLPGLEEGTDYYDRTNLLLEKVCSGVTPRVFYSCLWECVVFNAAVRLPAILFALSHFDRHYSMMDQLYLMGNDMEKLVNGLCSCFQDESVLIQRSSLDFLLVGFPMHDTNLSREQYEKLIHHSMITLLRRDMSLNRRLYAWLLGSDITSSTNSPVSFNTVEGSTKTFRNVKASESVDLYFKTHSKDLLVAAIKSMLLKVAGNNPHDLRPYRILISLLDKSDIGSVILDDILFEVFRLVYLCSQKPGINASNGPELLKSANLLFGSLEPRYLWQYVGELFLEACRRMPTCSSENLQCDIMPVNSGNPSLIEVCNVIMFLLDSLSLEIYSDTFSEYLPDLFLHIIMSLTDHCDTLDACQITVSLKLCLKILSKITLPTLLSPDRVPHSCDSSDYKVAERTEEGMIACEKLATSANSAIENKNEHCKSCSSQTEIREEEPNSCSKESGCDYSSCLHQVLKKEKESSTMERCLHHYKKFYVTFIFVIRLKLGETRNISALFKCLLIKSPQIAAEDKAKRLELLLFKILRESGSGRFCLSSKIHNVISQAQDCDCELKNGNCCCFPSIYSSGTTGLEWQSPVSYASKLLIELSTFQMSVSVNSSFKDTFKRNEEEVLPDWLKSLTVCSCWLGNTSVPLQLIAISTLLDLCVQCRRTATCANRFSIDEKISVSSLSSSKSDQVVTVVLFVPLLTLDQLLFIEQHTNVFQVIIHWLWLHLESTSYEVKCTELLCQLQNSLHLSDLIERCIGESLSMVQSETSRFQAFRKFFKLWHISREINKNNNYSSIDDSLYRCMLKVLDNLHSSDNHYLKLETENWLFHSLLRGDCCRIIEPLLLILLDYKSARIGVSYANIQLRTDSDELVFSIFTMHGSSVACHILRNVSQANAKDINVTSRESSIAKGSPDNCGSLRSNEIVSQECVVHDLPIEECTEVSQTCTLNFDSTEDNFIFNDRLSQNDLYKYNTLPLAKGKFFRNDKINHKKFGLHSSLESLEKTESFRWNETSSQNNIHFSEIINMTEKQDVNSTKIKVTRTSVSDDGLAMDDGSVKSGKDVELIRSLSFSGRNTATEYVHEDKDCPRGIHRNEMPNLFFAKTVVEEIIKEIVDQVVSGKNLDFVTNLEKEEEGDSAISCNSGCSSVTLEYDKENLCYDDDDGLNKKYPNNLGLKPEEKTDSSLTIDQFYSHMLLYCSIYDQDIVLYIISKFRDILRVNAGIFLFLSLTCNVSSQTTLVNLLVKHRNSIFAKGFHGYESSSETIHKNTSYLEVVITVCFYYIRCYYPNFGDASVTNKEILGNKQVQLECIELLTQIFFQLCRILPQSENETVVCVRQLLNRCKVQKIILHSIWCCLLDDSLQNVHIFIKEIVDFNGGRSQLGETAANEYIRAFQMQYLRLLLSLIALENELYSKEENGFIKQENYSNWASSYEFVSDKPIVQQPLFFNLLKKLLEPDVRRRTIHERVISFIIVGLQYFRRSLSKIIVSVIQLLCCNIEAASDVYVKSVEYRKKQKLPTNYIVILMDALTVFSHYCLLDFNSQQFRKMVTEMSTIKTFKSLFQMYSDFPNSAFQCNGRNQLGDCLSEATESVLNNLPKMFASVSLLWKTAAGSKQNEYENDAGSLPTIRNQILNLLNPIAAYHSTHFIISVAVVWKEKMIFSNNHNSNIIPEANEDQMVLVQLLSSLMSVTPDIFMNSIYRIIKPQVSATLNNKEVDIEISALEMLVHYIQIITVSKLSECWNFLAPLLREASNISVQSQFLLSAAVNYFVRRLPSSPDYAMDKKDFKDLQDVVVKLVEISTQIAGACLEQTTWLRRNLAVRDNNNACLNAGILSTGILFGKDTDKQGGIGVQYSVYAQLLLADVLIPLLDYVFCSPDKEKLVVILINVMYNITPYLKNHTRKNSNNFFACSQVLATITSYQYTRKAWKKDVVDLLLDSSLFQMEVRSLKHWRMIVANLMCQETSTFRDLLGRISVTQNNALNLFSSKEQEYEQRSQLLKRLAFGILCCEHDQFHKHMPDIQEKLAESLKLPQNTPGVQAQVFLCFRVLLLRMSPHHVTSLWPVIITEMVQVMLQMEYELSTDLEESSFQSRILSSPDWPWMYGTSNGIFSSSHPHWLQLQLAAAKLLKLAVQLPANRLPQFQMYRWAFVGNFKQLDTNCALVRNSNSTSSDSYSVDFIPHVTRVASLMNSKYGKIQKMHYDNLLPSASDVKTLQDFYLFFSMLSEGRISEVDSTVELENEIELDFMEQLPFTSVSNQSK